MHEAVIHLVHIYISEELHWSYVIALIASMFFEQYLFWIMPSYLVIVCDCVIVSLCSSEPSPPLSLPIQFSEVQWRQIQLRWTTGVFFIHWGINRLTLENLRWVIFTHAFVFTCFSLCCCYLSCVGPWVASVCSLTSLNEGVFPCSHPCLFSTGTCLGGFHPTLQQRVNICSQIKPFLELAASQPEDLLGNQSVATAYFTHWSQCTETPLSALLHHCSKVRS